MYVRCENAENCGVNFWIRQNVGIVDLQYTLAGAGALYAIAVDGTQEIEAISRIGVQLEEGRNRAARLGFRFIDERVHGVVLGIRLNEGLPNARETGTLEVSLVELDDQARPDVAPPAHSTWLILVPVTTAITENLERTDRFVVKDLGPSNEAVGRMAGSSLEDAIESSVENFVFTRVNHNQMLELRVSRTAFEWPNTQRAFDFLHA